MMARESNAKIDEDADIFLQLFGDYCGIYIFPLSNSSARILRTSVLGVCVLKLDNFAPAF